MPEHLGDDKSAIDVGHLQLACVILLGFNAYREKRLYFLKKEEKRRILVRFFLDESTQHMKWNFIKLQFRFRFLLAEPRITSPYGLSTTGIHQASSMCKKLCL